MNLQLRRSFTSLLGNTVPHLSMAQSGSVVNLNHVGMNITVGEFSRSIFLVNSRRVKMIPYMNKANSSYCGFYKPLASAAAADRFCILRISSDMKFALPSYEASANRFYSHLPRSLNKGDVVADGSEGSFKSSQRLKAAAARRKTNSMPKNSDSVAEVENQSAKQESKTKEVKKVTRSKKDSKDKKLSGKEAAESNSASSAKKSSSAPSVIKSSSASLAKKSRSASKSPTLAKGETLSSAEMKENIAEDKQDESASTSTKKESTKKKSTKKEKIKAQEITDINSLVKSELKPLYPPNGKSVVVVESVTKAKVIQAYLGQMYEVLPSYGHVRDLAARSGSVRPDEDFSMVWEVPSAAWTHLKSIKVALSGADNLILASDPDREGEAIAWHIIEMLRQQDALHDNISVFRVVFHEITETSIKAALQSPRHIDANLVHAYLARRALDYLIGFNISPVLWRKLPGCQSAGRVQSAALSLISDREMEIDEFKPQEYWSCGVEFKRNPTEEFPISSNLTFFASKKLSQLSISSETEAKNIEEKVLSSNFKVAGYKNNKTRKNPPTPYITSTLQQDAANKLHFTATYTMKLAQKLYEGIQLADGKAVGLITYTRTDGLHISDDAVKDIQSFVRERYGPDFAAKTARKYFKKVKNAQEAHEAVRPTDIRRLPSMLVNILDGDSLKLYSLIWSRTMACQMEPAIFAQIHVDIKSDDGLITFSSSCSKNDFLGYQAAFKDVEYEVGKSKETEAADRERVSKSLDSLKPGDDLTIGRVDLKQHFTQPPPRFSEASLVKKLEELGIGRPSTYASTLKVLQDRNYITVKSRVLHPEFRGRMVSAFLSHHFSEVTDLSFTADMETELDNVSAGSTEWKGLLKDYWTRFSSYCERAATVHIHQVEKMLEKTYENFLFASLPDQNRTCPSCSEGKLIFKVSRFGAGYFIGCDQHPTCKYIAKTLYGGEETDDVPQNNNTTIEEPKLLGLHPTTNEKILLKNGPYGSYVQLGEDRKGYTPKRASLSQMKDKDTITVEDALELLRYPVTLGTHPKDGSPVILKLAKVGITIRHRRTIADLPKNLKPDDVTLEKALEILSGKDVRRCGRPKGKQSVEEALNISLLSNF